MKLSIRGKHGNHNIKKYRRTTYRRNNNRNKRTQYVSHGGSAVLPIDIECVASTYIFQTELSYKNTGKWYTKTAKSNFNIKFTKQQPLDIESNALNFELIMERIHKKTDVVDKIFTIYFTVVFIEERDPNHHNQPFCFNCYTIYYSQSSNTAKKILDATFTLDAPIKNTIDSIFTVSNDEINGKPVYTYTFKCNDSTNKTFFTSLVNQMNKCIMKKYRDLKKKK
jgi:hypothetical protein